MNGSRSSNAAVIHSHCPKERKPLYTTWKEGVWFKIHSRGVRGRVWQLLALILSKYPTYIKCEGEISELIEIVKASPRAHP